MAEQSAGEPKRHTTPRPIRVPDPLWRAYGRVCGRLGTDRTNDVLEHMKARVLEHGTDEDKADLARAEQELTERRARKGGRPPQS
jgi:CHAD domain-containing protein